VLSIQIFFGSFIVLFATISFSKAFFSKIWQELPMVALPNQEKIRFAFKRISASITARNRDRLA
jgi:hypothetical protein